MFGTETNARGVILEDFIINNYLVVENRGTRPTFQSSRYATCIDVTLSRGLSNVIKGWRVIEDFNGSDHNDIVFDIDAGLVEVESQRNWEKGDWDSFSKELEMAEFFRPEKITDSKLDKLVGKLYHIINKALDKACPKNKPLKRDPVNEWYTEEVDDKRKIVAEKFRQAKQTRQGSVEWNTYKKQYKLYRAMVRRCKRRCWNIYKQKCATPKETSRLLKILQRKESNVVSTFQKPDGNMTMPGEETARHLLDNHFPSNTNNKPTRYVHYKVPSFEVEGRFTSWINEELVKEALLKFENKKSPGPDDLKPLIFQFFPPNIIEIFTYIYKACVALGFTPTLWRESKVIFIPKPGKDDYTKANAFRPISLSNYLLKGLERLCVWRVDEALLQYPIHDRQHGFRCDRSTETAISEVSNEIESQIFKRKRTLGVFLDIKSAFDTISPDHIKRCLLNHRVPDTLVEWYYNYITNRNISVNLQEALVRASTSVGFPQGGVASARFWLVAFNMAVKIINSNGCKGTAFADDCAVLVSGTTKEMINAMQKTLTAIEDWGRRCGLTFNPSKTVVIMFGRRKDKSFRKLKMGGVDLEYSKETKYLGVVLDSRLTWKPHVRTKFDNAKKLLYKVTQAVRGNWGPAPQLSRWAMTGVVLPALTYAACCWAHVIRCKWMNKRLDRIDRLGLLAIAQCAPSSPTQALRVIYGVPPTRLVINKLALDTLLRYRERMTMDWDGLSRGCNAQKSHLRFLWDRAGCWDIDDRNVDDVREVAPARKYRVVTDSFSGGRKYLNPSQVNIFSDGSRTDEGVGSGFTIQKYGKEIIADELKLGDDCTVFQAEVFAIFEAIRRLLLHEMEGLKFVKIFSDSAAALYSLRKRKCKSKVVLYTMKILNRLAEKNVNISLVWIRAHVGHAGNERADQLAKRGTTADKFGWVDKPFNSVKRRVGDLMRREWEKEWGSYKGARMTKQFLPSILPEKSSEIVLLKRNDITKLVTMITGHNDLRYHYSLRNNDLESGCRLCGYEMETFHHLYTNCPRLNQERFKLFGVYQLTGTYGWEVTKVLQFANALPFNLRKPHDQVAHSFLSTSIFESSSSDAPQSDLTT